MAPGIRRHQIEGVTAAVGVVCEMAGVDATASAKQAVQVGPVELAELLATLDPAVRTLAFLTAEQASSLDADLTADVVRLVDALVAEPDHVAAIRRVPAVNAAKRVVDGVVVEAVDRETLNLLRPPEVVDRRALESALAGLGPNPAVRPINPTVLVASAGGRVLVLDAG